MENQPGGDAEAAQRRNRARARLRALGIDVGQMSHEQIRQVWEHTRQAYINAARAGTHLNPMRLEDDPMPGACLHARIGMLASALAAYFAWTDAPDDWSPLRVTWPTCNERHDGAQGR